MLLEIREIGRKTPMDGRLDITPGTFRRLQIIGDALHGRVGEDRAPARLDRMACRKCTTHGEDGGEHLFIVSDVYRGLVAGESCVIELADDAVTVEVSRPHSLTP